jgi:hypothetical protein
MPGDCRACQLDDLLRLIPRPGIEEHADDFLGSDPHGDPARRRHARLQPDLGNLLQGKRLDSASWPSLPSVPSDDDPFGRHVHRRSDAAEMPEETLVAGEIGRSGRLRPGTIVDGERRFIRPAVGGGRPARRRVWHGNGLLALGGLRMRPTPEGYGIDYK